MPRRTIWNPFSNDIAGTDNETWRNVANVGAKVGYAAIAAVALNYGVNRAKSALHLDDQKLIDGKTTYTILNDQNEFKNPDAQVTMKLDPDGYHLRFKYDVENSFLKLKGDDKGKAGLINLRTDYKGTVRFDEPIQSIEDLQKFSGFVFTELTELEPGLLNNISHDLVKNIGNTEDLTDKLANHLKTDARLLSVKGNDYPLIKPDRINIPPSYTAQPDSAKKNGGFQYGPKHYK